MLGLLLLYFLGKYFYDLALQYQKNPWKYAVLGILCYYLGMALGAFFIMLMVEWTNPGTSHRINDLALGLISIPFGLLMVKLTYVYLQKRFANPPRKIGARMTSAVLDDEFLV